MPRQIDAKATDVKYLQGFLTPDRINFPHFPHTFMLYTMKMWLLSTIVLEGYLPPKALSMVREWIEINRDDLQKIECSILGRCNQNI